MNFAALKAPFAPDRISWRVGSTNPAKDKGMALAYIDARDVMSRLDEVAGADWQCEYVPMPNGTCCCRIGIKNGSEWVWRSNGAINLTDSDKPDAKEMTEKGSYSDAFKRAAVLWGIGQYLYDLDSPWVRIEPMGRSYKIAAEEHSKLRALLAKGVSAQPISSNALTASKQPDETVQAEDRDVTEGVKNWVAQQKENINSCTTLPALTDWLDRNGGDLLKPSSGSALDRLRRKSNPAFNEIKTHYLARMNKV